jgi:hypothetical protein
VRVKRCLVDKPRHSGIALRGWLLNSSDRNPAKREPCNAVGEVLRWHDGDIVAVRFVVPSLLLPDDTLETILYAHIEDLVLTDAAVSWPLVEGVNVR